MRCLNSQVGKVKARKHPRVDLGFVMKPDSYNGSVTLAHSYYILLTMIEIGMVYQSWEAY